MVCLTLSLAGRSTLRPQHFAALRVSGWSEGVEEGPVGFPGVQQGSDPVVVEVGEPERGAFDESVGCFGGCVGDPGFVPVRDLGSPAPQGPAQLRQLRCTVAVGEVVGELFDGLSAGFGVGDVPLLWPLPSVSCSCRRALCRGSRALCRGRSGIGRKWGLATTPIEFS